MTLQVIYNLPHNKETITRIKEQFVIWEKRTLFPTRYQIRDQYLESIMNSKTENQKTK